jgi:chromosome segregation ATPase
MISQLEEIKERFLGNFSTEIVDEIHQAVTTITTAIDGVSSTTSSLDTKAGQINNAIATRADSIDAALGALRTELGAIDVKVASCSNQLGQLATLINSFKDDEKAHFDSLAKQMEAQENRLNTELDVVRKQNKIFSFIIIVLLTIVMGLFVFYK